MPIPHSPVGTAAPVSPAPGYDDLTQANQGAKGNCFLLDVRNSSQETRELIDQITEMVLRSGLEVTITPIDHVLASKLVPSPQISNERQLAAIRGEVQLVRWTQDGTLLDGAKIQQAWGLTHQAIDAARDQGEIFSVWVKGQHWYPAEALKFKREELAEINRKLGEIDPSSKLLFLLHKHGALEGMTPADAVANLKLSDVCRVAAEWKHT